MKLNRILSGDGEACHKAVKVSVSYFRVVSQSAGLLLRGDDLQHGDDGGFEGDGYYERQRIRYHCQAQEQNELGTKNK